VLLIAGTFILGLIVAGSICIPQLKRWKKKARKKSTLPFQMAPFPGFCHPPQYGMTSFPVASRSAHHPKFPACSFHRECVFISQRIRLIFSFLPFFFKLVQFSSKMPSLFFFQFKLFYNIPYFYFLQQL